MLLPCASLDLGFGYVLRSSEWAVAVKMMQSCPCPEAGESTRAQVMPVVEMESFLREAVGRPCLAQAADLALEAAVSQAALLQRAAKQMVYRQGAPFRW